MITFFSFQKHTEFASACQVMYNAEKSVNLDCLLLHAFMRVKDASRNCSHQYQKTPPQKENNMRPQKINNSLSYDDFLRKTHHADEIITKYVSSALWISLLPMPILDFVAVTWIQLKMIKQLAALYDIPFSQNKAKSIVAALAGGGFSASAGYRMLCSASKMFYAPLLGAVGSGIAAGASTYAVGKVFSRHFAEGGTFLSFDPHGARAFYQEMFNEGVSVMKKNNGQIEIPCQTLEENTDIHVAVKAEEAELLSAQETALTADHAVTIKEESITSDDEQYDIHTDIPLEVPSQKTGEQSDFHDADQSRQSIAADKTTSYQETILTDQNGSIIHNDKKVDEYLSGVSIIDIHFQGEVKNKQSDEYIEICNNSFCSVDISGWQVLPFGGRGRRVFTFPKGTILESMQIIRVYTNEIHSDSGGFSFGSSRAVWRDYGGIGILLDADKKEVSMYVYGDKKDD